MLFSTAAACALTTAPHAALANPLDGQVVSGQVDIASAGNLMTINQYTLAAIVNWRSFSIAPGEIVNFNQPTPYSTILNRVVGNERSVIEGAMHANGQVFIVNSAGILFSKDAQVNVGGLVASTLDISNADFNAGKYVFAGSSKESVINHGAITANPGGYVALLGNNVSNEGVIEATLGTVALASGDNVTLNFGGNSLVDVTVNKGTLNALVENKGVIKADGGRVVLTARAADALLSAQVNNTGVIQARTMAGLMGGPSRTGVIKLAAIGGKVRVSGRLDASAPQGGNGGKIVTQGSKVTVAPDADVTTSAPSGRPGDWIINSHGFKIGQNGDIGGAQLATLLGLNNVTIRSVGTGSEGDISVSDAVAWSASTNLTLDAARNIDIASSLTATGASANLALQFGGDYVFKNAASSISLTGQNAWLTINGQSYQLINTIAELAALADNPDAIASGFYALNSDIDAGSRVFGGPVIYTLSGTLAGMGHSIRNLTIADDSGNNPNALIGTANDSAVVRDLTLVNTHVLVGLADPRAAGNAAALVSWNQGLISNSYAYGGYISGSSRVGGLVSSNFGSIINSGTDISVAGRDSIGGLVANNFMFGIINNSFANGFIFAGSPSTTFGGLVNAGDAGGLVGINAGAISDSRANVAITTYNAQHTGGLVGYNMNIGFGLPGGEIKNSSATGWINATWQYPLGGDSHTAIGGLVGYNWGGVISDGFAKVDITLNSIAGSPFPISAVGGLVGVNDFALDETGGVITRSVSLSNIYNDGWVNNIGGLVGVAFAGSITDNYAAGQVTSGVDVVPYGAGGLIGNTGGVATLSGNSWDIAATGQTSGFGAIPAQQPTSGATGLGDPNSAPPWAIATPGSPTISTQVALNAEQLGTVISTTNTAQQAASPPSRGMAAAGVAAVSSMASPTLNSQVDIKETPREAPSQSTSRAPARVSSLGSGARAASRGSAAAEDARAHRQAGPQTAAKPAASKPKAADYGAAIQSIEVDGKRFNLQDRAPGAPNKPAQQR
ncbi:filamentous hemagglutinin N-terminal domain-containing protein [Methylocystis sp. JR02]|uniref:two-partner secretion domain-containing protein n=1 Tax=Methylocystis sp. JR02 TaxID=3046284 RepID=UPI0024B98E91|nr:filamentous hemagglutinin N-terminal domain-containing protein [Methylocystis sp. JR02]MDJ0449546.1 filamentous hemagglutinin N-terminal domain-containing protein [Methylocystis sp. JR02]